MHRLEQLIAEWRKRMMAARAIGRETVEELENHLREIIDEQVRTGRTELEAFQKAVAQVGSPPAVSLEFEKLARATWWPVKVAAGMGFATAIAMTLFLAARFNDGSFSLLLASHVFTVTLGYVTMFLIGSVGICFVCRRCCSEFSPARLESLSRVSFLFGGVAACLTAIGIVLGMIWAKAELGRFWSWDAKETGAACVLAWLVFFMAAQRSRRVSARGVLLLAIGGNVVLSWGWFGANALSQVPYGTSNYSMPAVITGLNFAFLVVGLAPAGWIRLRRA